MQDVVDGRDGSECCVDELFVNRLAFFDVSPACLHRIMASCKLQNVDNLVDYQEELCPYDKFLLELLPCFFMLLRGK